jgi:putative endonuclease
MWYLYLIECNNGALYAGITTDVEARFKVHAAGKGAKYTRANPPVRLVGCRAYADRSSAAKAEWAIRQLPRAQKIDFLSVA